MIVLIAVSLIFVIWFFVDDKAQTSVQETSQAEDCDSCTARHKNLTRLRDAGGLAVKTVE